MLFIKYVILLNKFISYVLTWLIKYRPSMVGDKSEDRVVGGVQCPAAEGIVKWGNVFVGLG